MTTEFRVILRPVFVPTEFERRGGIIVEHARHEPWATREPNTAQVRHRYFEGDLPPQGPDELGYSFSVEPDVDETADPIGRPIVHRGLSEAQATLLAKRLNAAIDVCHREWGFTPPATTDEGGAGE